MGLAAGELAVAAVVGLIPPDASALREHRVLARTHPWIVGPPPAAGDDHLVADLDVLHVAAHGPDDARAVAPAGVENLGITRLLALGDHIERSSQCGPHAV